MPGAPAAIALLSWIKAVAAAVADHARRSLMHCKKSVTIPVCGAACTGVTDERRAPAVDPSRSGFSQLVLAQYLPILIFLAVGVLIGAVAIGLGRVVAPHRPDEEKLSPYECGFEAFEDARAQFDVRYYLVAILFIIFDLEIAFLFPWAVVLEEIGLFGFSAMMLFLAILVIGFIYEWRKGALEWE